LPLIDRLRQGLFGHDIHSGGRRVRTCDAPPDAVTIYSGSALFRWLDKHF
jgi:hypothetical protein